MATRKSIRGISEVASRYDSDVPVMRVCKLGDVLEILEDKARTDLTGVFILGAYRGLVLVCTNTGDCVESFPAHMAAAEAEGMPVSLGEVRALVAEALTMTSITDPACYFVGVMYSEGQLYSNRPLALPDLGFILGAAAEADSN